MALEKEDWEENCWAYRPTAEGSELPHGNVRRPIEDIIDEYDGILAKEDLEGADAFLREWLDRFVSEDDWADELTILNEIMGLCRSTNEKEEALQAVKDGIGIVGEHSLGDSVSGGTTYLNAATTMKAFGYAKEAMPYYEQAARAYEHNLAPQDYRFGGLFNNMALALEDLGEYDKAEAYYLKAMGIMEGLEPESLLEVALTWINLAVLYEKWGKDEKTDGCIAQAIDIFTDDRVPRDDYYAFNCRKCAKTFGHFGYFKMEKMLTEEADRIYGAGTEG